MSLVFMFETMFRRRVKRLPRISSKHQRDLGWALVPIFVWMQILGIPTGRFHSSWTIHRYVVLFVGMMMMTSVLFSVTDRMLNYKNRQANNLMKKLTDTEKWIDALQEFQTYCATITMNFSLFIVANIKWTSMWKKATEIEESMEFDQAFYCSVRKLSTAALTLLMLVRFSRSVKNKRHHVLNDSHLAFYFRL